MKKFFYTPGPSELYFSYDRHLKEAHARQIGSLYHRSAEFKKVFQETTGNLKALLSLPAGYEVMFLGSATEIMERIVLDTVKTSSYHVVNGAFSERALKFAQHNLGDVRFTRGELGTLPAIEQVNATGAEVIFLTINETSAGVRIPSSYVESVRSQFPDALIAVDVVSSAPVDDLDYSLVDMAFFSVQKCFGMPPGLGVWIANERAVEKAKAMDNHRSIFHNLPQLYERSRQHEPTETPNTTAIYMLGKIAGDMNQKGLEMIRRETKYKAAVLYHMLDEHPELSAFVGEAGVRSDTVIVANCNAPSSVIGTMNQKGFVLSTGYGSYRDKQLRIANFPTHSKEQVEFLADTLSDVRINAHH